jgi:predicted small secreted protein
MTRTFFAILAVCAGAALAGCNTAEGLGEDVETAGEALEEEAEEASE